MPLTGLRNGIPKERRLGPTGSHREMQRYALLLLFCRSCDRVFSRAGASGFQLKTTDGAINPETLRELVDSDDRLRVIEGDAEMTINRKLRTDLSLTIATKSKKLKLSHYRKRLTRGNGQSVAIGTMAQYSDEDDDDET